jgi:hypothetical protein
MALTSEDIAEALGLDYEKHTVAVDEMRKRVSERMAALDSNPMMRTRAEADVKAELLEWQSAMHLGDRPKPTDTKGWTDGVTLCLERAAKSYEESSRFAEEVDDEAEQVSVREKERTQEFGEEMDKEAEGLGLPVLRADTGPRPKFSVAADMGDVIAVELGADQAVRTENLSTCTGVSLFDPVTKVGAMMHVYNGTGKPTIVEALAAMKHVDSRVEPGRLQVSMMPGTFEGADTHTHTLVDLHAQLSRAGITHVRDFSKEGRSADGLMLRGDGVVISTTGTAKVSVASARPESPDTRGRSDSVGSADSVDMRPSPSAPVVSAKGAGGGGGSTSDHPTPSRGPEPPSEGPETPDEAEESQGYAPPPPPKVLPVLTGDFSDDDEESPSVALPPTPVPELPGPPGPNTPEAPDVSTSPRSLTVRERLAMEKSGPPSRSQGLGAGDPPTVSKVKM